MKPEDEIMEHEANVFAMELLMPTKWLLEDLRNGIDIGDAEAINKLAKKYKVDPVLMALRIGQLMKDHWTRRLAQPINDRIDPIDLITPCDAPLRR